MKALFLNIVYLFMITTMYVTNSSCISRDFNKKIVDTALMLYRYEKDLKIATVIYYLHNHSWPSDAIMLQKFSEENSLPFKSSDYSYLSFNNRHNGDIMIEFVTKEFEKYSSLISDSPMVLSFIITVQDIEWIKNNIDTSSSAGLKSHTQKPVVVHVCKGMLFQ